MPLNCKEVCDMAKEYVENVSDYVQVFNRNRKEGGFPQASNSSGSSNFNTQSQNKNFRSGFKGRNDSKFEEMTRKYLAGHKFRGREFCINYNLKDDRGKTKCKDRKCTRAHNCGFIPRGESTSCGKNYPKFNHHKC